MWRVIISTSSAWQKKSYFCGKNGMVVRCHLCGGEENVVRITTHPSILALPLFFGKMAYKGNIVLVLYTVSPCCFFL